MSAVHTTFRTDAHGYTRSQTPWIVDDSKSPYGKLIRYLSGGGLKSFGRTVKQEEAWFKHRKFYLRAGVFAAFWLLFYFL